ncbi:MAG: T9SS type A sorting domain-containing protein [Lewinellaceae bacterium]|nr:T9SS type A sorting domain-containing protein [Lewinellaceae bacterium]
MTKLYLLTRGIPFIFENLALLGLTFALLIGCTLQQLRAQCDNTTVINISGPSTTTWTAPSTGGPFLVHITATGAGGGANTVNLMNDGGTGAIMSGSFLVQNNQTLRAIAGDFGKNATLEGAGGGGGSGVVNCGNPSNCAGGTILVIAAGGGGGDEFIGLGGSSLTNGNGSGGLAGGEPLHQPDWGGGGGGLNSSGQNSAGSGGFGGGQVFKSGLSAGGIGSRTQDINDGGNGMGGGGGGGDYGGGGGGGHTGGNGGNGAPAKSFNSGTSQSNSSGINGGGANVGTVMVVCLQALPVELLDFKAHVQDESIRLLWSTGSEKDNLGFHVERSIDNHHWHAMGFVQGHGSSVVRNDYEFTDTHPVPGINYYRLKQVDSDGSFEYSPIVVADVRHKDNQVDIYPNPSPDGIFSLRMVSTTEGTARLEIFDWAGYKVYGESVQLLKGTVIYPVSMTTFPKGSYTARLELPDGRIVYRKILLP